MKRLLWWLIAGSRGGVNRGQILLALKDRPYNANQLAEAVALDYKTVRHHLKVLVENNCLVATGKGQYGAMYFISPLLEENWKDFEEVWTKVKKPPPPEGGGGKSGAPPAGGAP